MGNCQWIGPGSRYPGMIEGRMANDGIVADPETA